MALTGTPDTALQDIIKILIALILPPVAVALEVGMNQQFWINVLLTLCGWLPGMIHAVYVVAKN